MVYWYSDWKKIKEIDNARKIDDILQARKEAIMWFVEELTINPSVAKVEDDLLELPIIKMSWEDHGE